MEFSTITQSETFKNHIDQPGKFPKPFMLTFIPSKAP